MLSWIWFILHLQDMPSASTCVRAEILAFSRTQSTVRRCRSQELSTTTSDFIPAHENFQRTHSVSALCSLFEQASLTSVGERV